MSHCIESLSHIIEVLHLFDVFNVLFSVGIITVLAVSWRKEFISFFGPMLAAECLSIVLSLMTVAVRSFPESSSVSIFLSVGLNLMAGILNFIGIVLFFIYISQRMKEVDHG